MPWRQEAMKDVVMLRKSFGESQAGVDPEMSEGETGRGHSSVTVRLNT